jgi:hypothetical protein
METLPEDMAVATDRYVCLNLESKVNGFPNRVE